MDQGLLQGPSWEWYCSHFWVPGCPIGPVHGQRRLRGKKRVVLCSPAFQLIRTAKQSPPAAKAHPAPAGELWELLKLLEQRSSLKITEFTTLQPMFLVFGGSIYGTGNHHSCPFPLAPADRNRKMQRLFNLCANPCYGVWH